MGVTFLGNRVGTANPSLSFDKGGGRANESVGEFMVLNFSAIEFAFSLSFYNEEEICIIKIYSVQERF